MKQIGKIVRPQRLTLDEMRSRFRVIPEEYLDKYTGGCDFCATWKSEGKYVFTPWSWEEIMKSDTVWSGGWVCGRGYVPADAYFEGTAGRYCHFHENYKIEYKGLCFYCLNDMPINGAFQSTYDDIMNQDYFYGKNDYSNCWDACVAILKRYNITNPGSRLNVYQLTWEYGAGLDHNYPAGGVNYNYSRALACIDRHLNSGRPIIVGVNHTPGKTINEGATDHFIVVTGKGYDAEKQQYYYVYVDPGRSAVSKGCNTENNRLYYNADTNEFFDSEGGWENERFDVTQVRPNDGIHLEETTEQRPSGIKN